MGGRIKRDGSYDERNRYYEKRDYSFRSTTFFVSYVTLNATTVTKSATIHYGTSNPIEKRYRKRDALVVKYLCQQKTTTKDIPNEQEQR